MKDLFEAAGWTAKRELFDADLYVTMGETELVVEIAMEDTAREIDHVEEHLETGFDVVWVICRTKAVRDGLQQRLAERDVSADSVAFRTFRDIPSPKNESFADFGDFGVAE